MILRNANLVISPNYSVYYLCAADAEESCLSRQEEEGNRRH